MAGVDRCGPAGHPVAGDEQRPVEAAAVVGHEPAVGAGWREASASSRAGSSAWSGSSSWTCRNVVPDPPAEADEEGDRAGGGREPGRLRVEADQRHVRRRLAGQRREPDPVDGDGPARGSRRTTTPSGAARPRRRSRRPGARPARPTPASAARGRGRSAAASGRGPVPLEPTGERRRAESHAVVRGGRAGTEPARRARASRRSASARASTPGSRRGPVHAGQPASQPQAAIRSAAPVEELVVALPEPFRQPDPARDRLVQVDRRLLGVRRADLGHQAEVARVDHQQDRGDGLDRPTRPRAARRRARHGASGRASSSTVSQ